MNWSNEKVISLINLYRDRGVLWNCKLNEYKDRNNVEIAVSFGVAKEEVERKIKNLICHFSREVKKKRDIRKKFRKPPPHLYSRFNSTISSKIKSFISSLTPYRALPLRLGRTQNCRFRGLWLSWSINITTTAATSKSSSVYIATEGYFQCGRSELCVAAATGFAIWSCHLAYIRIMGMRLYVFLGFLNRQYFSVQISDIGTVDAVSLVVN